MEIIRVDKTQGNLVFDLFDQYRVFYEQPSDIQVAEEFIRKRLDNNESVIFVALTDSVPSGFTQLYPTYSSTRVIRNWILNDLYVHSNYRKKGIGESLIKKAMEFAKDDGANFLQLSTAVDNLTAQRLYERVGFKIADPETDFYTYQITV